MRTSLMPRILRILATGFVLFAGSGMAQIDRLPLPFDLPPAPAPAKPAATPDAAAAPATTPPLPGQEGIHPTGHVAQIYLYIEPYQTRVEALYDMGAIFKWLTPDDANLPETLSVERQAQIVSDAEKLAADWCMLTTNESKQPYVAPAAFFVKGKPGATIPMKDKEELAANQCMLGFVWQFTINETPDEVEVAWKGWITEQKELPVTIIYGSQSERVVVNNVTKRIQWMNKGRLRPAPLAAVPTFDPSQPVRVPVGGILWVLGGLVFYWWIWHKDYRLPGGGLPYFGVWVFGLLLSSRLVVFTLQRGESAPVIAQAAEAQKIVSPLLRNVYRAFDHRAESRVYDVLERSVDGELLRKLYLETISALTLEGREGTRVLITDFEATVDKVSPHPGSGGFIADCSWSVLGNVGHWGHSHPRYNGYKARLTVQPMNGEWKLTSLDVQEVRRK